MNRKLQSAERWLCVSIIFVVSTSMGMAQSVNPAASPGNEFLRRQAGEALEQRLDALEESTPEPNETTRDIQQEQAQSNPVEGPCFAIKDVRITGVTLLPAKALNPLLTSYKGRCISLSGINILLKAITDLYMDKGYIEARVYVPEQDIAKTGALVLEASEGSLSDIYLNGEPTLNDGWLATAFPGMKGKAVNMRDVEQGLDQINRLSSNNAKTSMLPGKQPGSSVLNVEDKPALPWHFSIANNNLGQQSTGYSKTSMSFRMDNLVNLNDLISLTYDHSGPDYPWPNDGVGQSNSVSGSLSIPYGYWTFTLNGSFYKYTSSVPGNFGDIDTSGKSGQLGFSVDRVIYRDKNSITTLNAGLTYKETDNFLMGDLIEVGSRQYPSLSLGISHSTRMLGGVWVFDLAYNQGLGLFGATGRHDPGAGDAEPEFSKFSGTINVTRPFEIGQQKLQFSTMINGQYSPDNLYGAEQISLGGYSNVRGTRDSILFGNNGGFTRNEIVWRTMPWKDNALLAARLGELRPYAALDYGHIFSQTRFGIEGGDVSGWTVGARLAGGNIGADIGYSRIIKATAQTNSNDLFFVSTSLQW